MRFPRLIKSGYRVRQVDRRQLSNSSLTSILVYLLYFFSMSFVLSAALVESGLGLSTLRVCHGAIVLCLACKRLLSGVRPMLTSTMKFTLAVK